MEWNTNDEKDSRVVESTDWLPLSDYSKSLEHRAGVYIFANTKHDVKYIGKAGAARMVVEGKEGKSYNLTELLGEIYSATRRKKHTGANLVKVLYTNSGSKALDLEQDLIKKYNPVNNGVDLLKD